MDHLGRYELLRVLGAGGTGRVYEAARTDANGARTRVALKVLGSDALEREARIAGLLRHRNLVDVYEIGEDGGTWFCAMELCDGGSVGDRTPLPARAVVEVGLHVCDALSYAHEELGLVHLDLKPSNLLLAGDLVKVSDLGISRAAGFDGDGRIRGTPGYMPPEQASGKAVDARADVYALGVTLVELATGSRPGASQTVDTLDTLESIDPRSTFVELDLELDGVPYWLAPAVERAMNPDPSARWQSMAALAEALRGLHVEGPGLRDHLGLATQPSHAIARTALIGRQAEVSQMQDRLTQPGVVTLKGPAGIGKTRLAEGARGWWQSELELPSSWCSLVGAHDVDGLDAAVRAAIGVPAGPRDATTIGSALASRGPSLLVLDTFEHLLDHASEVDRWCAQAPEARVLVTSQVPLGVDREVVLPVGPLPAAAATTLLVAAARARGVDVAVDPSLTELAERLDGLPLALELAAGRLGVLSVRDVLERLGPSLLRRSSEDRHATLHGALDWSWDLLGPAARAAFAQLSVFEGGFTTEAAEAVVDLGGVSVADALQTLVDRSMVRALRGGRLDQLGPVRAYAGEHLEDPQPVFVRHGRWCAGLAHIGDELPNVLAACRRAVARADADVAAATLAVAWAEVRARGPFADVAILAGAVAQLAGLSVHQSMSAMHTAGCALRSLGRSDVARPHFEKTLSVAGRAGDIRMTARALIGLGGLEQDTGNLEDSLAHLERALVFADRAGDDALRADAMSDLAVAHAMRGDRVRALPLHEGAARLYRAQGAVGKMGRRLYGMGACLRETGRPDEARACFERSLAAVRQEGDRVGEGIALGNLAILETNLGRHDRARARYDDALRIYRELGNRRVEGTLLGHIALLHRAQGHPDEALDVARQALAIHLDVSNLRYEGYVRHGIGMIHQDAGRLDEARDEQLAALELGREVSDPQLQCEALRQLVHLEETIGRPDAARAWMARLVPLYRELGHDDTELLAGLTDA